MLEILLNNLRQVLVSNGFAVLDIGSYPKSFTLKDKYIAFVSLKSVICRQTGFDFDSGNRKRIYEYSVQCRLLGAAGDCSDRKELLNKAYDAQLAFMALGYGAELIDELKIDPALSRAQCTLKVTAQLTHTPTGG